MKKYLPQVISNLVAPKHIFASALLSPVRYYNKQKNLKRCKKIMKYQSQQEIHRQIAVAYLNLVEAIKYSDEPMALRYLSIQLYERYKQNSASFKLQQKISDISIVDCAQQTDTLTGNSWFYLDVVIKHFTTANRYGLERRIFEQNYKFQNNPLRKWYFNQLPLIQLQNQ